MLEISCIIFGNAVPFGEPFFVAFDTEIMMMKKRAWSRYGFGIMIVVLMASLSGLLWSPGSDAVRNASLFFLAVMLSSWYGGLGPGLCATVLSVLIRGYFFFPPLHSLHLMPGDGLNLTIFTCVSIVISYLSEARKRAEEQERTQREWFQVILSSIGEGVLVADPAGRINYLNPAAQSILDWRRGQEYGSSVHQVFPNQKGGEYPESGVWKETIVVSGSRKVFVETIHTRIEDSHGGILGDVLVIRDIGERKRQEEELRVSKEHLRLALAEARQANRIKDQFLAMVSHELRTPLTAILGWAELMRGGNLDTLHSRRAVEVVIRNAQLQKRLIEDLLDISRISSSKLVLDRIIVNVVFLLKAAIENAATVAFEKNIKIKALGEFASIEVLGDPVRLQQILGNLLSNAIKFSHPGSIVEIRWERLKQSVRIEVKDQGVGIPRDFLPYVFEPFRQADGGTARSRSGLGLGLAITHHLVRLHEGVIEVKSEGGAGGTTFTLLLPLRKENSQVVEARQLGTGSEVSPPGESTVKTAQEKPI